MSIDRTAPASAIATDKFAREKVSVKHPDAISHSKSTANVAVTRVEISQTSRQMVDSEQQDVDMTRVTAIQQALAAGEYQIDSEAIAGALVRNIIQF